MTDNIYEPRGAANKLFHCRDPMVLMDGPAGTGKTRAILEKINALANKYPGSRHLITRATRASMSESVLVTFEEKVMGLTHPVVQGPSRETRKVYRYPNGSAIVVVGLDNPGRTFSSEFDTFTVFEAWEITENDWELLFRTLRHGKMPYTQAIADTNPAGPTHWLNQRANRGALTRLISRHEDNPFIYDVKTQTWTERGKQYIATLDALTGHRKERLRYGRWVAAEGVVYSEFDAAAHIIDKLPPRFDQLWKRRYRVIDFGYNDPFVCQWWAVLDDVAVMYREWYMSRRLVEDHAKIILRWSGHEQFEATLADHDREDRETLHRHGVETIPADKEISTGIDAVKARLAVQATGQPRLLFYKHALIEADSELSNQKRPTSTLEEFDCYAWKQKRDGIAKDVPEDRDNHGMDAMRYLSKHLETGDNTCVWPVNGPWAIPNWST